MTAKLALGALSDPIVGTDFGAFSTGLYEEYGRVIREADIKGVSRFRKRGGVGNG